MFNDQEKKYIDMVEIRKNTCFVILHVHEHLESFNKFFRLASEKK